MRVKSLEIRDILSIKEANIDFEDNGLVLLEGWNFDDNKSNGAGKTAIFNSLSFGLYGDLPRKISMTEIVRDGAKKGYVKVTIDINGDEYVIRRERPVNLVITKNGTVETINQSQLEGIYQLNYDQFLISMYSAQNEGQKFIHLNDSDKKDFLLRLMDLHTFTEARKYVEIQLKELNNNKVLKEKELSSVNSKIEAYRDSQAELDIDQMIAKIATVEKSVGEASKAIIALQAIPKPDDSDFLSREATIYKQIDMFSSIKIKRAEFVSRRNFVKRAMSNIAVSYDPDKCEKCGFIKDQVHDHTEELDGLYKEDEKLIEDINKCDELLYKESSIRNKLAEIRNEKGVAFEQYNKALNRISELKTFIASTSLDKLKSRLIEAQSIGLKIDSLEQKRSSLVTDMLSIGKDMEIKETLSHMYGPTGAPAYIMDSIVDGFNDAVSKYVDMAWGSATYALKTYKETAKGDITTKFSETLTINGETKSVGSRSGGEQKLLSLCIDFAVIDVLSNNFSIQLNPIVLDEPFEHLDAVTRELMMEMLEEISMTRQIWVVDHTTEFKAMFTKTMKVEKKSGISSIVVE